MKIDLYITEKCIPCAHILAYIEQHDIGKDVNILTNKKHPLVSSYPSVIFNGASVVKGVEAIENFLSVHFVPKEISE